MCLGDCGGCDVTRDMHRPRHRPGPQDVCAIGRTSAEPLGACECSGGFCFCGLFVVFMGGDQ